MKTIITQGFVIVYVPIFDCEGAQRTIDFRRIGKRLYGGHLCHWTANKHVAEARKAARKALADA